MAKRARSSDSDEEVTANKRVRPSSDNEDDAEDYAEDYTEDDAEVDVEELGDGGGTAGTKSTKKDPVKFGRMTTQERNKFVDDVVASGLQPPERLAQDGWKGVQILGQGGFGVALRYARTVSSVLLLSSPPRLFPPSLPKATILSFYRGKVERRVDVI